MDMRRKIIACQPLDPARIFTAYGVTYLEYPVFDPSVEQALVNTRLSPDEVRKIWQTNQYVYWLLDGQKDFMSKPCLSSLSIRFINKDIGYGVFATEYISENTFIGDYAGIITPSSEISNEDGLYTFKYPPLFPDCSIVATTAGNYTRFVNHSRLKPNIVALMFYSSHPLAGHAVPKAGDPVGKYHILFFACEEILLGKQLLVNYGPHYFSEHPEKEHPL